MWILEYYRPELNRLDEIGNDIANFLGSKSHFINGAAIALILKLMLPIFVFWLVVRLLNMWLKVKLHYGVGWFVSLVYHTVGALFSKRIRESNKIERMYKKVGRQTYLRTKEAMLNDKYHLTIENVKLR